jgi:hypothetical protein
VVHPGSITELLHLLDPALRMLRARCARVVTLRECTNTEASSDIDR